MNFQSGEMNISIPHFLDLYLNVLLYYDTKSDFFVHINRGP